MDNQPKSDPAAELSTALSQVQSFFRRHQQRGRVGDLGGCRCRRRRVGILWDRAPLRYPGGFDEGVESILDPSIDFWGVQTCFLFCAEGLKASTSLVSV